MLNILDATNTVVGPISLKGDAFIGAIWKRPDILLISVSEKNRDCLVDGFLVNRHFTLEIEKVNRLIEPFRR